MNNEKSLHWPKFFIKFENINFKIFYDIETQTKLVQYIYTRGTFGAVNPFSNDSFHSHPSQA